MSDQSLNDKAKNASTSSFVTALVLNGAVFGIEVLIFTILRPRFKAIYEPRTYIPREKNRVKPLTSHFLGWPWAILKSNYEDIRRHNGMDSYFFVRFLRMMVKILLPIWLISWAVLLPIHAAGKNKGLEGLDKLTFGNVAQKPRYAAHIVLVYVFTAWILYVIKSEYRHFVYTRQRYLVDPEHSASAQANTILITGVPRKYLDEKMLYDLFSYLPGGVKQVWLNRDLKNLPDLADRRLKACNKLESAETKLISTAIKLRNKAAKKGGKNANPDADLESSPGLAGQLVPRDQRPSHRLPPLGFLPFGLPFMGQKVDTIEWARREIATTNERLDEGRRTVLEDSQKMGVGTSETYPPLNSAFVQFNQQIAAHLAAQVLTHSEPYRMAAKYTEVAPEDVIWSNLGLNPYEQRVRQAISYAATAGLIILWAFPVAFVGAVSNVPKLCQTYKWLNWICKLPRPVIGIISGILPPVGLAILMMLLPIILRLLARFEGIPRRTGLELSLMTRFFIFQVIHGFLIVTLSSGIISALPQLVNNPSGIPNLLASNLPGASNFFLTYAILQGLAGTAAGLLQIGPLIVYYLKLVLLASTPRSVFNIKSVLRSVAWGTLFPGMTLLSVITIAYMIISPVICGLSCVAFFLFYQVWKYLFLWQMGQPQWGDTGGLFFPKALTHVFVGLYIQHICLAALFFLAKAFPEGALTVVLIVFTAGYHYILRDSYGPLMHSLPLNLADKTYGIANIAGEDEDENAGFERDFGPVDSKKHLNGANHDETLNGNAKTISHPHTLKPRADDKYAGQAYRKDAHTVGEAGPDGIMTQSEVEQARMDRARQEQADFERRQAEGDPIALATARNGKARADAEEEGYLSEFQHPALETQRIVWVPRDELGLGEEEVRENEKAGVQSSCDGATMDGKGHVDVSSLPPGDEHRY